MSKETFLQSIKAGGTRAIAFHVVKTYVIPFGMPIMTLLIGLVTSVQWFYIWIGFLASLAFVFHWLLKMNEWLYRIKVEDKIVFSAIRFCRNIKTNGISIGFVVNNLADFPINFEVSNLVVKLGDKVPAEDHKGGAIYIIPAKGNGWYDSHSVQIDKIPKSGLIEGYIDFTINYGKSKNSLKNNFSAKKQLVAHFSQDGILQGGSWNDAV
jgi:hypothetical protein